MHIKITKGLDIPIAGKPEGEMTPLLESFHGPHRMIGLDLTPFEEIKFKILVNLEERVKRGQPLLEDKNVPGRMFVAPAGGIVREIRRGLKRRLLAIVIEVDAEEEIEIHAPIDLNGISKEELIHRMKRAGLFSHIRQRPFNLLANPEKKPRAIFVKAMESAPFVPPAELQVEGYEKEFQMGLDALGKLSDGHVHLVHAKSSQFHPFVEAKGVAVHTAEGPHPIGNVSVHIAAIDPITHAEDMVWTLNARDVVLIGYYLIHGKILVEKVIGVAGNGVIDGEQGFFRGREGVSISFLIDKKTKNEKYRLISGDPLTGNQVESEDFLGFDHSTVSVIPDSNEREFLHFFRLGKNKYTYSGAYLSGHLNHCAREYPFTTSLHGEHRPFIDSSVSDEVMPLNISTMHLVRAVLAEDFDLAVNLGLLEVDSEDFALPSFVCPSKIEMVDIIKKGLQRYAAEFLK